MKKIISTCPRTSVNLNDFELLANKYGYQFIESFPTGQGYQSVEMKSILSDAHICIVGDDEIDDQVFKSCTQLKYIIKWGSGIDQIDKVSASRNTIKVDNTPEILGKYVAEYTLGLIISSLRKIHTNHINMKNNTWDKDKGVSLFNKTVGILGFGDIGRNLSKLVTPFNCNVIYSDLNDFGLEFPKYRSFNKLIEESEILVIATPLTEETENIINTRSLKKADNLELLINVSRGGVINQNEILNIVKEGKLHYLCMDVYENEPPELSEEILNDKKIIFTSHNASNTIDASKEINSEILEKLEKFLGG
jgi:phosphoglycerate dehydrogenase-like enzyme